MGLEGQGHCVQHFGAQLFIRGVNLSFKETIPNPEQMFFSSVFVNF